MSAGSLKNKMELCEICKQKEGQLNECEGDGRMHHHGMVHILEGGLKWLCEECANIEAKKWQAARETRKKSK